MSDSSSSSEDENGKIKEAVDGTFLTEDLYTNDQAEIKCKAPPKSAPSLRNKNPQELSVNPLSIKVTPEFQRHVSRHLSKLLDELVDDSEIIQKNKKLKIRKHIKSGVKLLSSSNDYLNSTDKTNMCKTKFVRNGDLNEIDYEKRAKEVAVSPEWVLNQEETRFWAPNTKGKIEIIKIDENYGKITCKKKKKKKKKDR